MREQIERLVNKPEFTDFGRFGDSVIKFSDKYSDTSISKVYVDYSDKIFESVEDMLNQHKEIVEKDFYKSNGSLQWNFYYYFVFNKENYEKIIKSPIAREIESNTAFSRKKIVTLETLENSYPFASIFDEVSSKKTVNSDLSHEWMKILSENDLDEVFSEEKDATFDKVIARYIEGIPTKQNLEALVTSESSLVESPISIQKICLKKYRSFPANQSFRFSNANLIEGVNGKGKTSLLESIELVMCGKTFRHDKAEDADIGLTYNSSSNEEKYEPKETKKFQAREQFWYGIPATHNKNTLYTNFNRFNFFNTDASYRFSQSDEAGIIWKSFKALALGGDTAELEKRIAGFEDRFSKELKRATRDKEELETEVNELVLKKNQISQPSSAVKLNDIAINDFLTRLGAAVLIDSSSEDSMAQVSNLLAKTINKLNGISEKFPSIQSPTIGSIKIIHEDVLKLEASLKNTINGLDNFEKQKIELNVKIDELIKKEKSIDRFRQYLNHSNALNIKTIEENIFKLSQSNLNMQEILNNISDLDLLEDKIDNDNLAEKIKDLESSLKVILKIKDEIELQLKKSKESFEGLKEVVLEIKTLGRRFLSLSKSHECPLCSTILDREVLEQKISQINLEGSDLSHLFEQRKEIEIQIKKTNETISSLNKIFSALNQLPDSRNFTINQAKDFLKKEKLKLKLSAESHNLQEKAYNHLIDQGFSSSEFLFLAGGLGLDVLKDKDEVVLSFENVASDVSKQVNNLKEEIKSKEREQQNLKSKFRSEFPDVTLSEFDAESTDKVFVIGNKTKQAIDEVQNLLLDFPRFAQEVSLVDLNLEIKNYYDEIIGYLAFLEKIKQETATLKQMDQQIETKRRLLEGLSIKHQRLNKAVKAFEKIQTEHGANEAIAKFFTQNKSIIVNIFKVIHTPNEFEDLEINDEKIYVIKSGVRRELNTISTGQRTAVALSIFLGMHLSCPMAPKIILLDDPITFVDDLNVLAVLDFLRDLVIKGNRQLFFATANKKLSNLFKRKFDLIPGSLAIITPSVSN